MYFRSALIVLGWILSATLAADPRIVYVGDIQLTLGTTLSSGDTPLGNYVYVDITGGWFNTTSNYTAPGYASTPPLRGAILPGGHDYARVRTDNSIGIDVGLGFRSIDPQAPDFFWLTSHGYVAPDVVVSGGTYRTEFGQYDNYQVIRINTDNVVYGWLNAALLVGQERITFVDGVAATIELKVFRVVVNS